MLRRVALVRTDVSEKLSASNIRVIRVGEIGTALGEASNRRKRVTLLMKALSSSETPLLTRTIQRNITEDGILQENDVFVVPAST
jgi:hypothetical protein